MNNDVHMEYIQFGADLVDREDHDGLMLTFGGHTQVYLNERLLRNLVKFLEQCQKDGLAPRKLRTSVRPSDVWSLNFSFSPQSSRG